MERARDDFPRYVTTLSLRHPIVSWDVWYPPQRVDVPPQPTANHRQWLWNGTDLGDIRSEVWAYLPYMGGAILYFWDGSYVDAKRFRTSIPLLVDELKPLFGVRRLGRHSATLCGQKLLLTRLQPGDAYYMKQVELADWSSHRERLYHDIRQVYLFRCVLGMHLNTDNCLFIRWNEHHPTVTSHDDRSRADVTRLADNTVKRWFGSREIFIEEQRRFVARFNITRLRFKIAAVIRRIEPNLASWAGTIIERIWSMRRH